MRQYLERSEKYLTETLLPFWAERAVESTHGGFQTNYDRKGRRTAVTEKSMLSQARCVFAFSHAARLGFEWDECLDAITQGIDFLFLHFRDRQHDGYFWITEEDGHVKDNSKTIYGHSFLIYAFAEHALSTGDLRSANEACRLFDLLMAKAADIQYGGFFEHFTADWRLQAVRQGVFCELGQGCVDFAAVLSWLEQREYNGWVVVEQDVLPGMGSPRESAQRNRDYLRSKGV